jgi:hypothetical protein
MENEPGGRPARDMTHRMLRMCHIAVGLLLALAGPVSGWSAAHAGQQAPGNGLVMRALANELRSARDEQHPMRYRLRKSSPRLTQTKEIYETRDGGVACLIAINDQPLSAADAAKEEARLNDLLAYPSKQQHRKQSEDQDASRALKVLRALPTAFLYTYEGTSSGPSGTVAKYSFRPNPNYNPPDLETLVLASMEGEIWIDVAQERVTRLEGHLIHDVDFGWGILGRLYKGGWIVIEQAQVSGDQWRIVRLQLQMSGRVLFKTKSFDTVEETSHYTPLPIGLSYSQAIAMMRDQHGGMKLGGR